ncbi:hypothetical protein [Planktothricoides raciborskii]|uniref:Uncharacterized protein n=2 Tax=Planktothricoides raciborskii TaxID=132608 RepID=A0AAU8JKJ3_9CYAN|nr:hypothetical protein [Planktothricoides raciborskii]MBD2544436.1 hypothetical protein [Planktothricoides raciborskii FACHB-1370]MBD2585529.1 hypothetical protein [Planktothricoides raciborskii FACHB-1261]
MHNLDGGQKIRLYPTISGNIRQYPTISDIKLPAISDNIRQYPTISNNIRQYPTLNYRQYPTDKNFPLGNNINISSYHHFLSALVS